MKGKYNGFGHYFYKKSSKQYIGKLISLPFPSYKYFLKKGYWEDDKWTGEGKFIGPDKKVIKSGIWKNDVLETHKDEA